MGSPYGGEGADAALLKKASREESGCPYCKPTLVGWLKKPRRTG